MAEATDQIPNMMPATPAARLIVFACRLGNVFRHAQGDQQGVADAFVPLHDQELDRIRPLPQLLVFRMLG